MNVIWGSDREPELNRALAEWAAMRIFGTPKAFGPCTTMGVFDGANLIGAMVYHNWDRDADVIEISGAALHPRWLTKAVLWEMFAYPFDELGCQSIVMRVSPVDRRLRRILTAYAFQCFTLPRLRGRHEDENVFILTDDAWRNNGFHHQHKVIGHGEKGSLAA